MTSRGSSGSISLGTAQNSIREIRGWFRPLDQALFWELAERQNRRGCRGDILELGAYEGKSAVFLGWLCRDGERLVVNDVFEDEAGGLAENIREQDKYYRELSRSTFERNYLRAHGRLPTIHQCPSTSLMEYEIERRFRFVHVDGSHVYEVVAADIRTAKRLLVAGGLIVVDDYRVEHSPGVAAAVWEELATRSLQVLCLTQGKIYVVLSDDHPQWFEDLGRWIAGNDDVESDTHRLYGADAYRLRPRDKGLPRRSSFLGRLLRGRFASGPDPS